MRWYCVHWYSTIFFALLFASILLSYEFFPHSFGLAFDNSLNFSSAVDDKIAALRKEIIAGNIDRARALAEQMRAETKEKIEYAMMCAYWEAIQHNYGTAITLLEPFKGNALVKEQIRQLESAFKTKDDLYAKYGKLLVGYAGKSTNGIYFPDSQRIIFIHNGILYSLNQRTGEKKHIAKLGSKKIMGIAASWYPELYAVSVFNEGRYVIRVFSESDTDIAQKLEKALFAPSVNSITPFFSPNGKLCFFSSDRKPSKGGFDIFLTSFSKGEWMPPQNVGTLINTKGNEINPCLHADSDTLFFSSNGHKGLGGYDIYAIKLSAGTPAKNLGIPINTPTDELAQFTVTLYGNKIAFIEDGNIIEMPMLSFIESIPMRFVHGIINIEGEKLKSSVPIKVDSDRGQYDVFESLPDGRYSLNIPFLENCIILPVVKGYLLKTHECEAGKGTLIENINFDLPKIYAGMKMKYTIQFEKGSAEIPEREKGKLKELIRILQDNPHIKFEISGHSSGIGTQEAVERIAKLRVASVVDYLMEGNINPNQLVVKSYAAEKKITAVDPQTAARLSRRVEINVVSWDDSLNYLSRDEIKFRLSSIQNELETRRSTHLALPGYVLAGAAFVASGIGAYYSLRCIDIKNQYNEIVEEYRAIQYASWKIQQMEQYQQKLHSLEDEHSRYRKYSLYLYITSGTLASGAIILLVSDWFNRITIKKLEREAEKLQKLSFHIQILPNGNECSITYRF